MSTKQKTAAFMDDTEGNKRPVPSVSPTDKSSASEDRNGIARNKERSDAALGQEP